MQRSGANLQGYSIVHLCRYYCIVQSVRTFVNPLDKFFINYYYIRVLQVQDVTLAQINA